MWSWNGSDRSEVVFIYEFPSTMNEVGTVYSTAVTVVSAPIYLASRV